MKFKAPTNKDGEVVDMNASVSGGGAARFAVVDPDYYVAQIDNVKTEFFKDKKGQTILKIAPQFVLFNDNQTLINRQDYVVGYWNEKDNVLYHPEGNFPIWSTASFLFKSMGLLLQDGDDVDFEWHPDHIADRIIRVKTGIAGYVKGNRELSAKVEDFSKFNEMAEEAISDLTSGAIAFWTLENLTDIVGWFNERHNLSGDNVLKTKNVITGTYSVSEYEIAQNGFYLDETRNAVYSTKASYDRYQAAIKTGSKPKAKGAKGNW